MMDSQRAPTVLLTGATGLVGSGVGLLLATGGTDLSLSVLTRNPSKMQQSLASSAVTVQGDITKSQLGLSTAVYNRLQDSITGIIHCAADTRFGLELNSIRTTNVTGTVHMVEFARGCRKLQKFLHVSTLYVVGRCSGNLAEDPNRHTQGFLNTYQQSKYEAEEHLLQAMGEIPVMIVRLSSIIGDSRSGEVRRHNYVHQLLRLFPRNVLPVAPGDPNAPIDLISTEWAVSALAYLFSSAFRAGQILHLCSGAEKSLTVGEMMRTTVAVFESHPIGRTWCPIQLPELVSLSEFEVFAQKRRGKGDKLLDALLTALGYFLPHLAIVQSFENQKANQALLGSELILPHIQEYYPKVVNYCLETNWVGRRKSGAMPVATTALH